MQTILIREISKCYTGGQYIGLRAVIKFIITTLFLSNEQLDITSMIIKK